AAEHAAGRDQEDAARVGAAISRPHRVDILQPAQRGAFAPRRCQALRFQPAARARCDRARPGHERSRRAVLVSQQYIVFSHGQDGEPWGTKIVAMAEVARRHGLSVESVDYRGMADPAARVEKLLEVCKKLPGELLLVGSSLG